MPLGRTQVALAALLLASATTACTRPPTRDPAVAQDVLAYVAKIKQWEPVEVAVLNAIHDVRESQFVDDDYVISRLGDVMDDVELHLEEIGRFRPRTPQVTEVHDRYVKAWHDLHDAFGAVIAAMQRKDYLALADGTKAMGTARDELVTVAAALNLLMKDTGLKAEDDYGPPEAAVES